MSLLSRGELVELMPKHWLDRADDGWTCPSCNQDFSQDDPSFTHPDSRFVCLRVCADCNEAK